MKPENCRRCGKLFVGPGRLCSECIQQDERDFGLVREYLKINPSAKVIEIAGATGVDPDKIYEFVRRGRLQAISPQSDLAVSCEVCGARITSGRLCRRCADQLAKDASASLKRNDREIERRKLRIGEYNGKGKARMHIADKIHREVD